MYVYPKPLLRRDEKFRLSTATPTCHTVRKSRSIRSLVHLPASSLCRYGLFLLLILLACPVSLAAQPTELNSRYQELAQRYVEAFTQKSRLESGGPQEETRVGWFEEDFPNVETLLVGEKDVLERLFGQQLEELTQSISDRKNNLEKKLDDRKREWIGIRGDLYSKKIEISSSGSGTSFFGILKVILNSENRYFWLFSLVTMGILLVIHWHYRRHEYRRMLMGSRARSMHLARILKYLFLLFLVLTLVIFLFAGSLEGLFDNISNPDAITFSTLEKEVAELEASFDKEKDRAIEGSGIGYKGRRLKLATAAWGNRVTVATLIKVIEKYNLDIEDLKDTHTRFVDNKDLIYAQRKRHLFIRISLAGMLSLFALGFSYLLFKNIKRHRKQVANTCPQCLSIGSFKKIDSEYSFSNLDTVSCTSEDLVYGGECGFELHGIHREKTKLSFPTLGVPQAGKTHWLCMLYRELIRGAFDDMVNFERVRGESSEEMDRRVEEIIEERLNPEGTRTDALPKPLIFDFTDSDLWGKSNALVNIFDYAGEITQNRPLDDPQRQRALDADGYLFFIDPTDGASAEEQAKALVDFQEDLKVINRITTGQSIRTPVALCVPKLDLMINQDYADSSGRGAVSRFYRELSAIQINDSSISLDAINKRSDLMMNFRETVWPGWRIERQINDLFGGRFRFFPLTPVGMTDLGETDLRERTIEPFAILEPLMWLLHMNGFKVLS